MTLTDLARRLHKPSHRVRYALAAAGIEPAGRAGIIRLFVEEQIPAIEAALDKASRRELTGAHHA